jgi:hypothetical protein
MENVLENQTQLGDLKTASYEEIEACYGAYIRRIEEIDAEVAELKTQIAGDRKSRKNSVEKYQKIRLLEADRVDAQREAEFLRPILSDSRELHQAQKELEAFKQYKELTKKNDPLAAEIYRQLDALHILLCQLSQLRAQILREFMAAGNLVDGAIVELIDVPVEKIDPMVRQALELIESGNLNVVKGHHPRLEAAGLVVVPGRHLEFEGRKEVVR